MYDATGFFNVSGYYFLILKFPVVPADAKEWGYIKNFLISARRMYPLTFKKRGAPLAYTLYTYTLLYNAISLLCGNDRHPRSVSRCSLRHHPTKVNKKAIRHEQDTSFEWHRRKKSASFWSSSSSQSRSWLQFC